MFHVKHYHQWIKGYTLQPPSAAVSGIKSRPLKAEGVLLIRLRFWLEHAEAQIIFIVIIIHLYYNNLTINDKWILVFFVH